MSAFFAFIASSHLYSSIDYRYTIMTKQDKQILMRLSAKLKEQIDKKASDLGMGTSTYIRTLIIKDLKE